MTVLVISGQVRSGRTLPRVCVCYSLNASGINKWLAVSAGNSPEPRNSALWFDLEGAATLDRLSHTKVVWPGPASAWHSLLTMRVNIKARIPMHVYQEFHSLPLVLTIETAHGLAARCEHRTTAADLMWTLDQKTDINAGLLDRFRQKLRLIEEANLSDVELSDEVLNMFGFFL